MSDSNPATVAGNSDIDYGSLISMVLQQCDSAAIGLPAAPAPPVAIASAVAEAMEECLTELNGVEQSEAFNLSRDRYLAMAAIAMAHLPCGSNVAAGYAAPGHLPLLLERVGYTVSVFDPNRNWELAYAPASLRDRWTRHVVDLDMTELPYASGSMDAVVVSGVLERLVLRHPKDILPEFRRVLRDGGVVLFSTPNVSNISNVVSLIKGNNVFWDSDIFFGGTDRHNREFTPREVRELFEKNGFTVKDYFGMNDHANWRSGSAHHIYDFQAEHGDVDHALMRNTIVGVFAKSGN